MAGFVSKSIDHFSDVITDSLGSTYSVVIHTFIFAGFFLLRLAGIATDEILLILTTIVSLEAIYLSTFIQRAVNKQTQRLEYAIDKIVQNVCDNLEQPLDEVVGEIRKTVLDTHNAVLKKVAEESDQMVEEIGHKVETESDELVSSLTKDAK